ncbi:ATP-binding protein [Bacteriovoracales bacterium]|nr:ATP-binding protein [Bacteriovoracales bacterium]
MKLFLFLFFIASASFGEPLVLEKGKHFYELGLHLEIFEDPSGKLSIDEVEGKEFYTSREKVPNFGFSESVFWGRVTILNKLKKRNWFLSYNYVTQDYVTFFKKVGGKWISEEMGDSKKFSERKYKIRPFVFEGGKNEKEVYYIRVSGNPTQFDLSLLTKEKMLLLEGESNVKLSLFFGIVISMVLYNVFIFFFTKSLSYFYYVFYVLFFGLFLGGRKGLTQKYFFTDNVWFSNSGLLFFGAMVCIFLCLFTIEYLNLQKTKRWIYRFLIGGIVLGFIVVVFSFFAPYEATIRLFVVYALLIAAFVSVAGAYSMLKGYRPARYFVFAYFFMLIGAVITNLTMSDVLPIYPLFKEALIIGSALQLILFSMGLADKFNYQQEQAFIKENTLKNELESMKNGLEEKVTERTRELTKIQDERSLFFANLSHELRTPLNAILGFSQILQATKTDRDTKENDYVDSINTSGRSLLRLVNSVHDFTKIELNELKVEKKKCKLREILTSISLYFKNEAQSKGIFFELELGKDVPSWIESDELALKQVLDNLLSNALKFTKVGHIKIKVEGGFKENSDDLFDLFIQVEDTGAGMPGEKVRSLFEPFAQIHDHGSVKERGSGLGLYISKKIIDDLGGELGVISHIGKGSVFTIRLPSVTFFKDEADSGHFSYKFFGETILIADDVPINIKLYEAYLSQHNLKVEVARDGTELLEKARTIKPDLIMTDFDMPGLNVDRVLKTLRAETSSVPIILVSAIKNEVGEKKDFDAFLQKPVDESVFIKGLVKFLKHETVLIEDTSHEEESYEFVIPENLAKEELELVKEVCEKFSNWREFMPVSEIEIGCQAIREKLTKTKLANLIPLLKKLEESAGNFNINMLTTLLDGAIDKIKSNKISS